MKHEIFHSLFGHPIREYILMHDSSDPYANPKAGGILVGLNKGDGTFAVGYSIARDDLGDKFDPELGTKIAYGRALKERDSASKKRFRPLQYANCAREFDILLAYVNFCSRCRKYFKDCVPSKQTRSLEIQAEKAIQNCR